MAITWESVCRVLQGMVVFRETLDIYLRQSRDLGANLANPDHWGRSDIFEADPCFRGKSSLRFRIAPPRLI